MNERPVSRQIYDQCVTNHGGVRPMKRFLCVMSTVLLYFAVLTAQAADLRVRVFERGASKPMTGVSVCLGTQARIDQFGASITDANGYVMFESLPRAELVVTATREGYKSEQERLVTSNTSRMLVLSLTSGGGGPVCSAAGTGAARQQSGLRVMHFVINRGAARTASGHVTLDFSVSGKVTQYRASERADFSDTNWQDYSAAPAFVLSSGSGTKRVYLQVRRHSTMDDAVVETLSPVVSDTVFLGGN
jgi:hypothetical protein